MSRIENTIWCDGCGEEISWVPLMSGGHHYCCQNCLDGLPCKCYQWSELDLSRRDQESGADTDIETHFQLDQDS